MQQALWQSLHKRSVISGGLRPLASHWQPSSQALLAFLRRLPHCSLVLEEDWPPQGLRISCF